MITDSNALDLTEQARNWLPILELASKEVFEIMLASKLEPADVDQPETPAAFTAMVGLAGQMNGVMTLQCSAASAALMTSKMLGVTPDQAGPQMWDAVGELCNMVAGNFKNKLTGPSNGCLLSPPTVITGGDYSFHSLSDGAELMAHLMFEGAPIVIKLELHR